MSASGAINLLIYVIIIVIVIVVLLVVLKFFLGMLFIAPTVSATPAAYTETVGLVSLLPVGLSQSLIADTSHLLFNLF
jgi:hypothetical protein